MALVLNTNIASLQAQYALNSSQMGLQKSLQRLSTGLRINSAADDAAGLAISDGMTAQINGLNQAAQNATDGVSLTQTAGSGLQSIGNILQRMRQLAVQASNGTNTDSNRQDIQTEISQLYSEIDRISSSAQFNGINLFSGTTATKPITLQVGANAGQQMSFTIGEVSTKTLSLNSTISSGSLTSGRLGAFSQGSTLGIVLNGIQVSFSSNIVGGGGQPVVSNIVSQINAYSGQSGVTASAFNNVQGATATVSVNSTVSGLQIKVGGGTATTINNASTLSQLVDNINQQVAGVTASIGQNGNLVLNNTTGDRIEIGGNVANSGMTAGTYEGYLSFKSAGGQPISVAAGINPSSGSSSNVTGKDSLNALGLNQTAGNGVVVTGSRVFKEGSGYTIFSKSSGGSAVYDPTKNTTDIVKINGVLVGAANTRAASDMAQAINQISGQTGVTASASTSVALSLRLNKLSGGITINGNKIAFSAMSTDHSDLAKVVQKINNSGLAGIVASADQTSGRLVLTSSSGVDIKVQNTSTNSGITAAYRKASDTTAMVSGITSTFVVIRGEISLKGVNGRSVQIDGAGTEGTFSTFSKALSILSPYNNSGLKKFGLVSENSQSATGVGSAAAGLSVTTVEGANAALTAIDNAIKIVDTKQSELGALQNRLTATVSNLQVTSQNMAKARSGVQDTDFASETANMTRQQILQQAGTAMLAQANSLPNSILSLLK
ncbi:hypothetical protein KSF73_15670 [Burkholderiaceae bacterium DAT-1]|nr:hypothetical protein [Burkholderiaceae bacterium DAT-1]